MRLNKTIYPHEKYPERILQFGEGNFLRGFCDWMIDKMNREGDFQSSIVVVQPIENGQVEILNEQDGLYTLYSNGIKNGEVIKERFVITSISRGINPYQDYDQYLDIAKNPELKFVISNTTEAGISYDETDQLRDRPQKTFPGKLTAFLYERYKCFKGDKTKGLIFIPCELIDKNGQKLKEMIQKYIDRWNLGEGFREWIHQSNTFCNSLVDRIVPGFPKDRIKEITEDLGYEDRLVVEGESFHLWVIEGPDFVKSIFPAHKAGLNVRFVDDLTPYRTRKVRILNGAHTCMVPVSLLYGFETVRETIEDPVMGKFIQEAIFEEIIPTLDLPQKELDSFAKDVIDRFRNPFIKHYLLSIALNSHSKFCTRVLPSILAYKDRKGKLPEKLVFTLAALIALYKGKLNGAAIGLKDDKEILDMYQELWANYDGSPKGLGDIVEKVLAQKRIWGMDLNMVEGLKEEVVHYLYVIEDSGMREAVNEVM